MACYVCCHGDAATLQQTSPHGRQGFAPFPGGGDAFMTGFATDMLHQSGASYLQRGQAFMQQRMGFMSIDVMHYFFNLNTEYGGTSSF